MPREQVLNDPITMAEAKFIALSKMEADMNKNSVLIDDLTCAGFSIEYEIRFKLWRSPTPSTLVWGSKEVGDTLGAPEQETMNGEYSADISPTKTRQDNDLPLPVLVNTPTGLQKKRVRISHEKTGR